MPPINDIDVILQDPTTVRLLKLNTNTVNLSATSSNFVFDGLPNALNLTGVTYNTSTSTFTCTNVGATLAVNDRVLISGTNTSGTPLVIPGYNTSGRYYYIVTTNGSTTFKLSTSVGGSVMTTTGSGITGLNFSIPRSIAITARLNGLLRGNVAWTLTPTIPYTPDVVNPNKIIIKIEDVLNPVQITQFSVAATLANFLGNSYSDELSFYNVNSAASVVMADIVPDNRQVVTKSDGTAGVYTNATTTYTINSGTNSILGSLDSLSVTASTGVSFTYTKNGTTSSVFTTTASQTIAVSGTTSLSFAVTNLTNAVDSGTLTITALYKGVTYNQVFTVTKNKNGADAVVYEIEADNEISFNEVTNTFSPATVTYTAYKTIGFGLRQELKDTNARIILQRSNENTTYTAIGSAQNLTATSGKRTLSTTVDVTNFPDTTRYVRAILEVGSGTPVTYTVVDIETDSVSINGFSPVVADIAPDNRQVVTKSDGTAGVYTNATTTYTISKAGSNILGSLTSLIITPSTGVKFKYTTNTVVSAELSAATANIASPTLTSLVLAVTDLGTQDSGTLTITAIYRAVSYSQVFEVAKNKNGVDAVIYEIEANNEIIYDETSEAFIPTSVKYTAYKTIGFGLRQELKDSSARIVLERSNDNSTYTAVTGSPQTLSSTVSSLSLNTTVNATTFPNTTRYIRSTLQIFNAATSTWSTVDVETDNITINGSSPIIPRLSNDYEEIVTKNDGSGGDYSLAGTNYTIFRGIRNLIGNLSALTITASTGVSFTITRNGTVGSVLTTTTAQTVVTTGLTSLSVNITAIATAQDNGTLTISATHNAIVYSIVFSVSKNKSAESAVVYSIEPGNEIVYRSYNATVPFAPATVRYSAYKTTGFGSRQPLYDTTAKIRLERSNNGGYLSTDWIVIGTDVALANGINYRDLSTALSTANFPNTTRYVRASLLVGTTIVDTQTDAIFTDSGTVVSPVVPDLTLDNQYIATNKDGSGGNYSSATSEFTIYQGTTNIIGSLNSLTITPSTGVTYSYTRNGGTAVTALTNTQSVTVNGLTSLRIAITAIAIAQDIGTLTVSAVYAGATYTQVFSVTKSKNGDDAVIYEVEPSNEIVLTKANTYTPTTIVYTAYKTIGNGPRTVIAPTSTTDTEQFKIRLQRSTDNVTWTTIGTDTQLTNTITIRTLSTITGNGLPLPDSTIRYVRAILLRSTTGINGTYSEVDVETDNITINGSDGASSISAYLTNPAHDLLADSAGNITAPEYTAAKTFFIIYEGTTNVSSLWTYNVAAQAGLTITASTNVFTVSSLTVDSTYADITATRTGYSSITLRFSVIRKKPGIDGTSPIIVDITGPQLIQYNNTGTTPSPTSLTFKAQAKNTGTTTIYYRWTIDGTAQAIQNSTTGESSFTWSTSSSPAIPTNYFSTPKSIRVEISKSNTFSTILDDDVMSVAATRAGESATGQGVDIVFTKAAAGTTPTITVGSNTNPPAGSPTWYTTVQQARTNITTAGVLWSSVGTSTTSGGTTTWSWDSPILVEGSNGTDGNTVAEISAFTRTTGTPTQPTTNTGSVQFTASGTTVTAPTGGGVTWYTSIPAGTDPVWETRTVASVSGTTGTDGTLVWSVPVKILQNGADGSSPPSIKLTASRTTFTYTSAGNLEVTSPAQTPVTLTATISNWSADWWYTMEVNGGGQGTRQSVSAGTLVRSDTNVAIPALYTSMPQTYTIRVFSSSTSTTPIATDSLSFSATKAGISTTTTVSAKNLEFSTIPTITWNETASTFNPATISIVASWQNITPTSITWTSNATISAGQGTGTVTLQPVAAQKSLITATITVSDGTTTLTRSINIVPAKDGAPGQVGSHGIVSAVASLYKWTNSSTAPATPVSYNYFIVSGTYGGSSRLAGEIQIAQNSVSGGNWYSSVNAATAAVTLANGWHLWEIQAPLTVAAAVTQSNGSVKNIGFVNIIPSATNGSASYSSYYTDQNLYQTASSLTIKPAIISITGSATSGSAGSGMYAINRGGGAVTEPSTAEVNTATGRTTGPVVGDIATVYNTSTSVSYRYVGGTSPWTTITTFMSGNLIVQNSIAAQKLTIGNNSGYDRIQLYDNKLEVYGGGVLRVKIGYLL